MVNSGLNKETDILIDSIIFILEDDQRLVFKQNDIYTFSIECGEHTSLTYEINQSFTHRQDDSGSITVIFAKDLEKRIPNILNLNTIRVKSIHLFDIDGHCEFDFIINIHSDITMQFLSNMSKIGHSILTISGDVKRVYL